MKARSIILALMLMLVPKVASAQLDAIIGAVVDAIEPTPVYDTELTTATENLARRSSAPCTFSVSEIGAPTSAP